MKNKKMLLGSSILLVVLLVIGGTMAWFTAETPAIANNFKAGTLKIELIDIFETEKAQSVNPGDCFEKIVKVKNTGSKRAFVRIKMTEAFTNLNLEALNEGDSANPDYTLVTKLIDETNWMLKDDGYIYYKHVLAPNTETQPLFVNNQVCFVGAGMGNLYQGAKYDLTVKAEAIQVTNNAVETEWLGSGLVSVE